MRARGRAARARFATEHELRIAPSHVKNETGARRDQRELFRLLRDSRPGDAPSVTDAVQLHRLTDVGRPTPRAEIDARQIRVTARDRRERAADAVELADGLAAEPEGLREQVAAAVAARDKFAEDLTKLQALKQEAERDAQRAVERAMARELEAKDARISERTALDRAGRAEGEVGALRDQLARVQGAAAERDRLSQKLMDLEDQADGERQRAAERVAGLESELAEARKAERVVLLRAERAEGEATALREQLTQLTAALRDRSAGAVGRRGRREPS